MIRLEYEMTYWERIEGPLESTKNAPLGERLCWKVTEATLKGDKINAKLAMPGMDWMRLGPDDIRRPDLKIQLSSSEGSTILMYYSNALIKASELFLAALKSGCSTNFDDQYMRMSPQFETGDTNYAWLNQTFFIAEGRLAGDKEIEYLIYRVI